MNKNQSGLDCTVGGLRIWVDVNRLRTDKFVLRFVRCQTFEVNWRLRQDARPELAKCAANRHTGPGGLAMALRLRNLLSLAKSSRSLAHSLE